MALDGLQQTSRTLLAYIMHVAFYRLGHLSAFRDIMSGYSHRQARNGVFFVIIGLVVTGTVLAY